MHAVRCPECRGEVSIDPADLGYRVACPLCGERFTPRLPGAGLIPDDDEASPYRLREDEADLERPNRSRRRWEADEDDDLDRPIRSRRRRPVDWEEAERLVRGPATGLILTGWIGTALFLLTGFGLIIGGVAAMDAADRGLREMSVAILIYGVLFAIFSPYCIVLAIGGHKMKQLSSIGWAYTAAIMGITTIAVCGPIIPLTWAGLPLGIWAVVVLNKPEVKAAFEANKR